MEDGAEFQGKTVDDAVAQAERRYGVQRQDLDVQVITQGSRGVFGIGAEPARILARPRVAASSPTPASPPPTQAGDVIEPVPVEGAPPVSTEETVATTEPNALAEGEAYEDFEELDEAEVPVSAESQAELAIEAQQVLYDLLGAMGFDNVEVEIREGAEPTTLVVTGDHLGVLIGRRGDNLSALQFMVNLILSRGRRQWPRVVIDIENYRERREESLRTLAGRVAGRVQRYGRPFTLEAMPASDRRIIHLTLRDNEAVETYSIGEGPSRRVVVAPRRGTRRSS